MMQMPMLKAGDSVEIIAPASRCSDMQLFHLEELLVSWGLRCLIAKDIFAQDLFFANTDEARFLALKSALYHPETKAIICARGGYGSMRLIPPLSSLCPPPTPKLLIGMSDITALHLFLQQQWAWPGLHAGLAVDKFDSECIAATRSLLFGDVNEVVFQGVALNEAAKKSGFIKSRVVGGNLCLVQTSIGTGWQLKAEGKIILLEEIGERGYRVDRMLEHLRQAKILDNAAAIVLADFSGGLEPDGTSLIEPVLQNFATQCEMPVIRVAGIGHDRINFPIPLGTDTMLELGYSVKLRCSR
jgi:muramoyltetrapeptide carboxypeptidase